MYDVVIIGGGLAGLVSSIQLATSGLNVLVIEKKNYPFHRVCGEYISNETRPFLENIGLNINKLDISEINHFQFTSPSGRVLSSALELGGFGISRYKFDFALYQLAVQKGVTFWLGKNVEAVQLKQENTPFWQVNTTDGQSSTGRLVLGAYGKRTKLDASLHRDFFTKRSPYLGVKYHIRTDFPKDLIALHNFQDGYCGISAIEDNTFCLCYLTTRENLRRYGNIATMEQEVLCKNPHLKKIFNESTFLYERPEVINEISFAPKKAIENGILMVGDAAGLITPLCGNGMAMAIHGGKIAAAWATRFLKNEISREALEKGYQTDWQRQFARRLWVGRRVQQLFGDKWLSELTLSFFKTFPPLLPTLIRQTHGKVF